MKKNTPSVTLLVTALLAFAIIPTVYAITIITHAAQTKVAAAQPVVSQSNIEKN